MIRVYQYFRWLSLDIVLGAMLFLAFLADLYGVQLPLPVFLAMGTAIWLIYTADHLLDSLRECERLSERRLFHRRNFKSLVFVAGLVLIAGLVNVFFLPVEIIRAGALLAGCCISYLMLVYFFKELWIKEVLVAFGYAVGVFLAPVVMSESFSAIDIWLLAQLGLVALANLLIFSFFDEPDDKKAGFNSLVQKMGVKGTGRLVWTILLLAASGSVSSLAFLQAAFRQIELIYLGMSGILAVIFARPAYFGKMERFRIIGDAIFYLPAVFLLL